jgi:hypothetical protein
MRFISARKEGHSVIYTADDGSIIKYSGGDPAWRTNNPGNLWSDTVSKRNNEIGKFGNFAIFPDYETGHAALLDSLRTTHWNRDLKQLVDKYAPAGDGSNRPSRYLRFLRQKTGIKDNRKVRDFTQAQFEKLWRGIEKYEGGKRGKIEDVTPGRPSSEKKQITKVKKDRKGTIISYFIDGIGWVSKQRGIDLARMGEVDAVVAMSRLGNLYLRTRPSIEIVNLDDLG